MDSLIKLDRKLIVLIALCTTVSTNIILSSGLYYVHLDRGKFLIPEPLETQTPSPSEDSEATFFETPLNKIDIFNMLKRVVFWVLVPLALLFTLLSPENCKQRLVIITITTLGLQIFIDVWSNLVQQADLSQFQPELKNTHFPTIPSGIELPRPARVDPFPVYYYAIALFIFHSFLSAFLIIWRRLKPKTVSLETVAHKAQRALGDLEMGAEMMSLINIVSIFSLATVQNLRRKPDPPKERGFDLISPLERWDKLLRSTREGFYFQWRLSQQFLIITFETLAQRYGLIS